MSRDIFDMCAKQKGAGLFHVAQLKEGKKRPMFWNHSAPPPPFVAARKNA